MHIAIAGNIGSGKTTLTTMLAKHYGWTPKFETVAQNPYLDVFYEDMKRWAFNLEIFFLKERFKDVLSIAHCEKTVVQDRSIFEGVHVFSENNRDMGNLNERDFETYMELFGIMTSIVDAPDLMIYLRASVPHLVSNIQKRGRDYEQTMPIEYLENLNRRYENFIFNKYPGKVLVIEVDHLDYQHNPKDFSGIIDLIDAELFGLFSTTT
ncbi:deoxynucleoside kinase [Alloprevotella sp. OH1205_COT-284]|uniref:deoxynucleoside kinase n=1 Tax=Alloprevotella sp. OH1205_COT-284 TaxID=2491043 RepID=UPI000F5DCB58|nr:deoxynucleoside kinase [Alloprevotella sp. OH1205_COT-284]RRD80403.1 deoxynucleoside kinase [Alloprevotella sp. OH1205_COT-284]